MIYGYTCTHTPVVNFIRIGAFNAKPPPTKTRMQQERKDPSKEVIEIKPTQVNRENDLLSLRLCKYIEVCGIFLPDFTSSVYIITTL